MRDPRGAVSATTDRVIRHLTEPLQPEDFLNSPVAHDLVKKGLLVDYKQDDETHISSSRVAWVSQPSEWSRLQLLDAALLTLDVAERALEAGFELKDASAWNVIFDGSVPTFCDHLSFANIDRREWRAFGQFARHFIFPLVVAQKSGLPVHGQFRAFRDGLTPQLARSLCGWGFLFSSAAPLMLAANAHRETGGKDHSIRAGSGRGSLHANLLRYCRSSLPSRKRVAARAAADSGSRKNWSGYVRERSHYSSNALVRKSAILTEWIERTAPKWVLDLGANTGEYSLIAAKRGARVIAVDADHECIERLYLQARGQRELASALHPVVAQLDDLCAGRGWCGRESPGLLARLDGHCDLALLLGLMHHLTIACSVPAREVAAFASQVTREFAIVELIGEGDPMFKQLATQYDRQSDAAKLFGRSAQREAFEMYFEILEEAPLPKSERTLVLLKRKVA